MNAVDRLKQDHMALRTSLNNLEEVLPAELASRIAYQTNYRLFLRRHAVHLRRKERVIVSCRGALADLVPEALAHAEHEHRYESQLFRRLGRLLLCKRRSAQPRNELCTCFRRATTKLRRLMNEEEVTLWPAIQHIVIKRQRIGDRPIAFERSWWASSGA